MGRGTSTTRAWSPLTLLSVAAVSLMVMGVAIAPAASVQGAMGSEPGAAVDLQSQSHPVEATVASGAKDAFSAAAAPVPEPVAVASAGYSGAPAAGVPDPGSAQAIAYGMMADYGWDDNEYNCLVALWGRESGWNAYAYNASSGAYGIPQALPGEKMASAGSDWATNPATQIIWGFSYIAGRYGTPCGAWESSQTRGWY